MTTTIKEKKIEKLSKESELNFYFEQALKHPHTRVEFTRNKQRQKMGVMIAAIDPTNNTKVIVGFSLTHKKWDDFDHLKFGFIKEKDFGKKIAYRRALKWKDKDQSFIYSIKLETRSSAIVYIPQTVHESLACFVFGCYKYYKDKEFPQWVDHYFPIKESDDE